MARSFAAEADGQLGVDLSPYMRFSIALWLYWPSYTNDDAMVFEYSNAAGSASGGLYLSPNFAGFGSGFGISVFGGGSNGYWLYPRASVPAAQWNHIMISTDRVVGDVDLFINGAKLGVGSTSGTYPTGTAFTNQTMYLGHRESGSTLKATCKMAHMAMWAQSLRPNGALDYGVPLALYNGANPLTAFRPSELLGYWPMQDLLAWNAHGLSKNVAPRAKGVIIGDIETTATIVPDPVLVRSLPADPIYVPGPALGTLAGVATMRAGRS